MSKSIIVTGASRGIGRAVAIQLLKHFDSNVVAVARSEKDLNSLKDHIEKDLGLLGRLEIVIGDVADDQVVERAVQKSLDAWGKLDGIVANAAIIQPMGKIADANIQDWKSQFYVNFFSVAVLFQKAIPYLRASKGCIITVSSGAANYPSNGFGPYSTSKAALKMLTSLMASEEPDIIAFSIRPGVVDTEMQQIIRELGAPLLPPEKHQKHTMLHEKNMLLKPEVPGHVIAALVSGRATKEMSGNYYNWDDEKFIDLQLKA